MKWLNQSNRWLHVFAGFLTALFFTILSSALVSVTCEIKDKAKGGKFDWLDIVATMLGGIIGQIIQLLLIFIAKKDGIESVLLGVSVNVIFIYGIIALLTKNWKWIFTMWFK